MTRLHARFAQAGGFVAEGRINGSLNLSRALGDMDYKQHAALGPDAQMVRRPARALPHGCAALHRPAPHPKSPSTLYMRFPSAACQDASDLEQTTAVSAHVTGWYWF